MALRGAQWDEALPVWRWAGEAAADAVIQAVGWLVRWMHGEPLRQWVLWLTGEPAGLKLNEELGHMVGGAAVEAVSAWEGAVMLLAVHMGPVLVLAAAVSWLGITFALACASDALSVVSLHLWALQWALASLHASVSTLLGTLWLLFQGKKRNPLRSRIDSIDPEHPYAAQQLLVGTLLFACALLIVPTVTIYYAFFSAAWAVCLALTAMLWIMRTVLSDLPAAGMAVRVLCPQTLPASLRLQLLPPLPAHAPHPHSARLGHHSLSARLESVATGSLSLLWPYLSTLRRLANHYRSANVVGALLHGNTIPGPPDEDEAMLRGEREREAQEQRQRAAASTHAFTAPAEPSSSRNQASTGDLGVAAADHKPVVWFQGLRQLRTRAVASLQGLRRDIEGREATPTAPAAPTESGSVLDMPPTSVFVHDCVVLWLEATRVVFV
jgi:signal transduction histidine kinase